MIPLTTLYDDYIDRPNLTEQKKPIWVYSSSPTNVGRNNYKNDNKEIQYQQSGYVVLLAEMLPFSNGIFTTKRDKLEPMFVRRSKQKSINHLLYSFRSNLNLESSILPNFNTFLEKNFHGTHSRKNWNDTQYNSKMLFPQIMKRSCSIHEKHL